MSTKKKAGFIRRTLGSALNIRNWTDYEQHKGVFGYYLKQALRISATPKTLHKETFAEARERLNLTEAQIQKQASQALRLTMIFFSLALLLFGYSILLAWQKHFFAFMITFLLTLVLISRAFYFHFWYFQIKHRKLGCTISEWLNGKVEKEKHES